MKDLRTYCVLVLLLISSGLYVAAQIGPLGHVRKLPVQKVYNIEDGAKVRGSQSLRTLDEYYIAYSDSDENITYADRYGRKKLSKLRFLQALFVLKSRNGYCKVIAYDPKVLAGVAGVGSLLDAQKKRYHLADRKKVKYLGWIKENQLLHTPNALVGRTNLQPYKYLASINHPKMITQRAQFFENDSILMTHAPGFRKKMKGKALVGDWMYVYKKLGKPAQYLVGTEPFIDPDSAYGSFGWVSDSIVLPLAQNMLLMPPMSERNEAQKTNAKFPVHWTDNRPNDLDADSDYIDLRRHTFQNEKYWMLPVKYPIEVKFDSIRRDMSTFIPTDLVDIHDSKVYNCVGQPFTYQEFQALQKQLNTINIVVVFEDGKEGKEAIRGMITSFQDLSEKTQSDYLAGFNFNYAAVGYMGRWVSDTLNWTKSFSSWLNFIQRRADDASVELETYEHVMLRGIQEAAVMFKGKEREHNIVIVIGSKINATTFPKLFEHVVPLLASASTNLLFLQSNLGKAQNYSDFVMQAKHMLDEVGKEEKRYRQQIIVDNNLVKFQNSLEVIKHCGNGYLYDFPEKSMQKGGLFFPDANGKLCPDLFEWVMDTIFHQISLDHDLLLSGMNEKFALLSRLQQNVNPRLKETLEEQGIIGLPDQIANTYDDKFFVEVIANYDPHSDNFCPSFLIREDAFAVLGQDLRRVVIDPKVNRNGDSEIDFDDRKRWYRELRKTYLDRNRFFGYRGGIGSVSLAKVIFMETGFPVNNPYFQQLPLSSIKRKAEQEELLPAIQYFYRDILSMEAYPSERQESIFKRGTHQYFILPLEKLP